MNVIGEQGLKSAVMDVFFLPFGSFVKEDPNFDKCFLELHVRLKKD